jgi:hypothetical protein
MMTQDEIKKAVADQLTSTTNIAYAAASGWSEAAVRYTNWLIAAERAGTVSEAE